MPSSLDQIIARGGSEQVEFKRGIGKRNAAAKTLCAMLNGSRGGCVLFGVRDDGEVIGVEVGHETHQRLRGEFSKIDPPLRSIWRPYRWMAERLS